MWFTVSALSRSRRAADAGDQQLFEESIVLVEAVDEDAAREAGEACARKQAVEFENIQGEQVRWTFERVLAVFEVGNEAPRAGTEVFSRFLRKREAESLATPFPE